MAEQKLLKLTISKVDGPVFDGAVTAVTLPGIEGEMTLLPEHEALISPLRTGTITIQQPGAEDTTIPINGGTLEVSENHATVLI